MDGNLELNRHRNGQKLKDIKPKKNIKNLVEGKGNTLNRKINSNVQGQKVKIQENEQKQKQKMWRVATWNVRSIMGKEDELIEEFEEIDIDILGVTEIKMKGRGEKIIKNGHLLIYSGVEMNQRAKAGVGCIVKEKYIKYITKWEAISPRILKIEMEIEYQVSTTVIIVYGPNEDEEVKQKEEFWEILEEVTEDAKARLIVMGDFNGRVGKKDEETRETIGMYGERTRNNNGKRLIDYCLNNNLIATNTFFAHKEIHKYTREVRSRNEKSIIDYILINQRYKKEVKDIRVRRGPEIYTDHYLVMAKICISESKKERGIKSKKQKSKEVIRNYKLRQTEIATRYKKKIGKEMKELNSLDVNTDLEVLWASIKNIIRKAAKETCGTIRINKHKKQTNWWNEEIQEMVKMKKHMWRKYLKEKTIENYLQYKQQRVKAKELIKAAKQQSWEEFGEKMEKDSQTNQKLFYKILKTIRTNKKYNNKYIKSKEGQILEEDKEIMARWKEYFEDMLNTTKKIQKYEEQEEEQVKRELTEEHDQEIQIEEVKEAITKIKLGKAAGYDDISPEMIKNMEERSIEILTKLFNKIWTEEKIPQDWEIGIIMPIFKKGDYRDCRNYRGITMISIVAKMYERILDNRLKIQIETQLEDTQSGFRKGRGVQDHIFTIKQIMEKRGNKNIYMAFIDLEKAFDSVSRKEIWESLKRRGVNKKLRDNIKTMYKITRNYVRTGNSQSDIFETKDGLRQGGVLSPTLFNVIMDDVLKEVKGKVNKLPVGYRNMEIMTISDCAFADDIVIFAKNEIDLQQNLEIWNKSLRKRNLKINSEKTKIMIIGKDDKQASVTLDGRKIEQVNTIKYLGVNLNKDGKNEAEINERIEKAMRNYYALNNKFIRRKEISIKTKITVYKTIYKPVLTYGSESWVLTKQQKSRIQAAEMRYLRAIKGITRRDRIRNEIVRTELKVEPILSNIERQHLKWFGHLIRMEDQRQPKRIWQTKAQERRTRGRPKKKWNDVVAECLEGRKIDWIKGIKMARDRKEWARFVHKITLTLSGINKEK